MSLSRARRSVLYLPASNAKALEKARTLSCDAVILDLEDSVGPDAKGQAREQMVEAVRHGGFGGRELVVRINGIDTPWGGADIEAVLSISPDAVLVPKVNNAADLRRYNSAFKPAAAGLQLWAMIETARSAFRLDDIAAASADTRLSAFVIGTNDFAKETGANPGIARAPFIGFLGLAVAAAKAYDLAAIDGVFNELDDIEGFRTQCRQGADFGFDGKTLIHPKQIDICNEIFSPSPGQIAWAEAIVAAFDLPDNTEKGVIRLDGKMVERLHLLQAQRLLAMLGQIEQPPR